MCYAKRLHPISIFTMADQADVQRYVSLGVAPHVRQIDMFTQVSCLALLAMANNCDSMPTGQRPRLSDLARFLACSLRPLRRL